MNVIFRSGPGCDSVNELSDAYVDGELLTGVSTGIRGHLSSCRRCRTLIDGKIRLRDELRTSVKALAAPEFLGRHIQMLIRSTH